MATYFGILKKDVVYKDIKSKLANAGMKALKHYPKLGVVKFTADQLPKNSELQEYFESIEEEKRNFSI